MGATIAWEHRAPSVTEDLELAIDLPRISLSLLLRAARYAHSAHCSAWQFAVPLAELRAAGLSECDLRWLTWKGYVELAPAASQAPAAAGRAARDQPLQFTNRSSFILTPRGMRLAKQLLAGFPAAMVRDNEPEIFTTLISSPCSPAPCWDRQRRELRVGQILIKRFCVPAENQETILAAFEEEAWPAHIDDPLPPAPEIDPKRRLHSTIQCLNRNQKAQLLHFHGDGYGRGIRWERQSV